MVKRATLPKRVVHQDKTPEIGHNEGQNQDGFLIHVGQILKTKAAVEAVKKTLKAARRAALDAGYNLQDLDEAISMREQEPETVQARIMRKAQYATWMGIAPALKQGDLFSDATVDEDEKWYAEGREDGLLGISAKGDRYDLSTPAGEKRTEGWEDGQRVLHQKLVEDSEAAKAKKKADAEAAKTKADKKAKAATKAPAELESTH